MKIRHRCFGMSKSKFCSRMRQIRELLWLARRENGEVSIPLLLYSSGASAVCGLGVDMPNCPPGGGGGGGGCNICYGPNIAFAEVMCKPARASADGEVAPFSSYSWHSIQRQGQSACVCGALEQHLAHPPPAN